MSNVVGVLCTANNPEESAYLRYDTHHPPKIKLHQEAWYLPDQDHRRRCPETYIHEATKVGFYQNGFI